MTTPTDSSVGEASSELGRPPPQPIRTTAARHLQEQEDAQPLANSTDDGPPSRSAGGIGWGVRHTRIGAAWAAVSVAVMLGVALVDFIVENTRSMRIDFFGASGHIPTAVALLVAALGGAFIVLAVGVCRTTQLRFMVRHQQRSEKRNFAADDDRRATSPRGLARRSHRSPTRVKTRSAAWHISR